MTTCIYPWWHPLGCNCGYTAKVKIGGPQPPDVLGVCTETIKVEHVIVCYSDIGTFYQTPAKVTRDVRGVRRIEVDMKRWGVFSVGSVMLVDKLPSTFVTPTLLVYTRKEDKKMRMYSDTIGGGEATCRAEIDRLADLIYNGYHHGYGILKEFADKERKRRTADRRTELQHRIETLQKELEAL